MENDEEVQDKLRSLGKDAFDVPALSDALRDEILARTSRRVRRRPVRRRAMAAGCMVAMYVAGALTVVLGRSETPRTLVPPTAKVTVPAEAPSKPSRPTPEQLLARVPGAGHQEQMRLLREAGDIYLNDYVDIDRALNCYRQVLELGSVYGQPPSNPDDTWLFASLVSSARKETRHEGKSSS